MPSKPTQRKTFGDLFNSVDKFVMTAVTQDELKEVMDEIAKMLKQVREQMDENTAKNKEELTNEVSRLNELMNAAERKLTQLIAKEKQGLSGEFDTKLNELRAYVGYVEDLIEYYDDSEVREEIKSVQKSIPTVHEPFNPAPLKKEIENINKELENIKKMKINAAKGGGVSDMAVAHALGRAVITETPTGTINGVNTDFTVSSTIHAVLGFELNSRVISVGEYTITGALRKGITFDTAIPAAYSGKSFKIIYI